MILDDIRTKLLEVDPNVMYGAFDKSFNEPIMDYIVFNRNNIGINKDKTSYSYYFSVHIVREEYIPEGLDRIVIAKMLEIPGMRLSEEKPVYDYSMKPNTNVVLEMLSIDFVKPVKV